MIEVKCKQCEKKFKVYPSELKASENKYCSRKCYIKILSNRISKIPKKICPQCKIIFTPRRRSQIYCNKKCFYEALSKKKSGKGNPMFGIHLTISKETRKKISKASSGKNNPMFGIHLTVSKKTKKKKLNSWTKERRQKQSEMFKGAKHIHFKGGKEASIKRRINKVKNTPRLKLKSNISSLIYHRLKARSLSKNKKSTFDFLPYTVNELKNHLENQFEPLMDWNNWGKGRGKWNIDHIKPDSLFNYTSVEDEEFQECWALKNLQPLWWIDNIKKGNKIR